MPKNRRKTRRLRTKRNRNKNKNRRTRTRTRTRRNYPKYNMVGCNHRKCNKCHKLACHCGHNGGSSPIGGLQIKGGGCFGPLVGAPYSNETGGNYYKLPSPEAYSVDRNMELRGGSIPLPSNLVNVGRQMVYGAQSVVNGLGGYPAGVDPAPYVQNKI